VTCKVWRGRGADQEPYHSQTDLQPVRLCRAAAVCGCLMGEMPESAARLAGLTRVVQASFIARRHPLGLAIVSFGARPM
jgi:hypothetical protein